MRSLKLRARGATLVLATCMISWTFAPSALAQRRHAGPVSDLSNGTLESLVSSQQHAVERCAARVHTAAYLADVSVNVRPGARPSTLYNARITVSVRSRNRDGELERCVQAAVRDSLRHAAYAVPRAVQARRTFQISERRPPREPPPPPAYSEGEVHSVLNGASSGLSQCLGVVGVPEQVTLRIEVEADGRLTLMNASLPGGASPDALTCLSTRMRRLRVRSRPGRRVSVTHTLGVRGRAW